MGSLGGSHSTSYNSTKLSREKSILDRQDGVRGVGVSRTRRGMEKTTSLLVA